MLIDLDLLIDFTDWEREKWHDWLLQHDAQVLKMSIGSHGDGRFQTVGDLMRHIFSAEKRYVERLSGSPLSDPVAVPSDNLEELFQFGRLSRTGLKDFVTRFPAAHEWDAPQELKFPNFNAVVTATPKKIVIHVLVHEIRHWAQIATLFRLNGWAGEFHDLLFSPVLGGGFKREPAKAKEP